MIFPKEFVRHFDICNDYNFRHKKLFYLVKNMILKNYSAEDGYDLQKWNTVTISSFGDIYEVDEAYGNKCWMDHECSEPRWASTHKHILQRFKLTYVASANWNKTSFNIYHTPTPEFYFESLNRDGSIYVKESGNYWELRKQCAGRDGKIKCIGLKKQKNVRKNSLDPVESLKWLVEYCKTKSIRNPQLRLILI